MPTCVVGAGSRKTRPGAKDTAASTLNSPGNSAYCLHRIWGGAVWVWSSSSAGDPSLQHGVTFDIAVVVVELKPLIGVLAGRGNPDHRIRCTNEHPAQCPGAAPRALPGEVVPVGFRVRRRGDWGTRVRTSGHATAPIRHRPIDAWEQRFRRSSAYVCRRIGALCSIGGVRNRDCAKRSRRRRAAPAEGPPLTLTTAERPPVLLCSLEPHPSAVSGVSHLDQDVSGRRRLTHLSVARGGAQ